MSALYFRSLKSGRVTLPGDPHVDQALCYLPDWARAAVALAEKRAELGQFEDIPFAGHTATGEQIVRDASRISGRTYSASPLPWFVFRLASPFWELARELLEMRYLYNTSHRLSPARLVALLPDFRVTSWETVIDEAVRSALAPALPA